MDIDKLIMYILAPAQCVRTSVWTLNSCVCSQMPVADQCARPDLQQPNNAHSCLRIIEQMLLMPKDLHCSQVSMLNTLTSAVICNRY